MGTKRRLLVSIMPPITRAKRCKENIVASIAVKANKRCSSISSKLKEKEPEISVKINQPKRIFRLPSKIEDIFVSPSRNRSVKPSHSSSTPITQNKSNCISKSVSKKTPQSTPRKNTSRLQQNLIEYYLEKENADPNNNPKRNKKTLQKSESQLESSNKNTLSSINGNKVYAVKNTSFKVLETKNQKKLGEEQDIYEFTFDPADEPPVQKKKRKRTVKKKTVIINSNYDLKLAKSLEVLKNVVSNNKSQKHLNKATESLNKKPHSKQDSVQTGLHAPSKTITEMKQDDNPHILNHVNNHNSVRIEDIAAQLDPTPVHHEIDYSPVNSPIAVMPITEDSNRGPSITRAVNSDPLNLQDELSFFDDQPVANSSMNTSKHPTASPWRVEYNDLPIKWKVNTYVKPNMTPALDCSYIENSTKKQVYTNILSESHNIMPESESSNVNLKQSTMTSFIKDAVRKSLNKSKNKKSYSPTKQNSLFEESFNISAEHRAPSPIFEDNEPRIDDGDNLNNHEMTTRSRKRKSEEPIKVGKNKTQRKEHDNTLFGFDDSENVDQENISPEIIDKRRNRKLRPKPGTVLQELNVMAGPARAVVPARIKLGINSEEVNKIYEQLKSAAPPPSFPEKDADKIQQTTHFNGDSDCESDSNSVHLFEDIELVHHMKTTRKSYGKPKKVTFRQGSTSDSEDEPPQVEPDGFNDDLSDLTYHMPVEKKKTGKKKITKKQKVTKKEEKEAEQWAAQFNSMCEDVDEFDLVVE